MKTPRYVLGFLSLLCLSGLHFAAQAQSYGIAKFTIAGGGGLNSTGGTYSASGTIGPSGAGGPLSGAPYSLVGGF